MKEFQKGILDNDRVISAENVQRMGEVIALCCIKTVITRSGKDLHKLYADLLHDIIFVKNVVAVNAIKSVKTRTISNYMLPLA